MAYTMQVGSYCYYAYSLYIVSMGLAIVSITDSYGTGKCMWAGVANCHNYKKFKVCFNMRS